MIFPQKIVRLNKRPFLIFTIYALLTIVMTWPAFGQLGTHIPGTIGDSYVHLWTFTWLKNNLLHLTSLDAFFTNQIYYPVGVSLLNHNLAWVNFAIWLPLQAVFGPEAGYTLSFLLIFPLNGVATYLFLREIELPETAAFIGGLVAAFWPYNLSHHGHPNLILIAFVPLSLLYLHRIQQSQRWQDVALTALFIALTGITRWQMLIIAAPLLGLFLLRALFTAGSIAPKVAVRYAIAGTLALLLMAPLLWPVATYQLNRSEPADLLVEEVSYPADLAAYVTPGRYHPLWGEAIHPFTRRLVGNNIYVRFVGFFALLLAISGAVYQFRRARFWLLAAGVYLLLALGPTLHIVGTPTIPLPYRLVEESFILQNLRFPDRFNVLLALPMAALVALGSHALLGKRPFQHKPYAAANLICLLLLFEYSNHYQTLPLASPDWYRTISQEETSFAILDIPAFNDEKYNKHYLRYQLIHGKPIVSGRVARPPDEAFAFIRQVPLLQNLRTGQSPPGNIPNVSHQMALLANENVRYLLLHRQYLSAAEEQAWRNWLVQPPAHEDRDLLVYSTEPQTIGHSIPLAKPVPLSPNSGAFGLITFAFPAEVKQGGWLPIQTVWGAANPVNADLTTCLEFVSQDETENYESCRPIAEGWLSANWQSNEIVHAAYPIQIDPFAPPGSYQIVLRLFADGQLVSQRPLPLGSFSVTPLPRRFAATTPETEQTAVWQNLILLHGYDLSQTSEQLSLNLHWQALVRPETSFKFFIHLLDQTTGEVVSQIDYVPQDWTYPTNWWEAGEYVVDTAVLPLNNIDSGTYQLLVGIYDPETGERLLATSAESDTAVDAVLLTELNK